jgi:hypothetical protein
MELFDKGVARPLMANTLRRTVAAVETRLAVVKRRKSAGTDELPKTSSKVL